MYSVYEIRCIKNDKVYIGQTNDFETRIENHIRELQRGTHSNPYIQNDFNRYGLSCFKFSVLQECATREENLRQETYWIDYYGGIDSDTTYNVKGNIKDNKQYAIRKSVHLIATSFKNHKHTEESKSKISSTLKEGYKLGKYKESRSRFSGKDNGFYGKKHTDETKELLSKQKLGKRKYKEELIDTLITEFEGQNYNELSKKYNIPESTLVYLIHHKQEYLDFGLANKYKKSNKV